MKIPWDKIKTWHKRLILIMGVGIAVSYFNPKIVIVFKYIHGAITFQAQRPIYEKQLRMLVNYIKVDKGLAKSQMDLIDSLPRYVKVEINGKLEEIKADVYRGNSGDCKVFVEDEDVGMYAAYYNFTQNNWEYYDFYNQYHLTYVK
jgi:hypothetical protein